MTSTAAAAAPSAYNKNPELVVMMRRGSLGGLLAGLVLASSVGAQRGMVPVRGVVFDSLRGQPIRNATVSIAGNSQVITTDSRGRFLRVEEDQEIEAAILFRSQ